MAIVGNLGNTQMRVLDRFTDAEMLRRWRGGADTLDIASVMNVPEHVVYARLPLLRARAAQDQEWNIDRGVQPCL